MSDGKYMDDGGQAFPYAPYDSKAMTLRDYFAARCPESWIERHNPTTVGDVRNAMIKRGIIPADRAEGDVFRSYDGNDRITLDAMLRYEYADAMIKARKAAVPVAQRAGA
jgi:hypothetical protein